MKKGHLNYIEISQKKLLQNAETLKNFNKNIAISPVLKSNAYGHGLEVIGPLLDKLDFPFFCVNSLQEAYRLKSSGVKSEILIMGYVDPEDLDENALDFSFALFDSNQAKVLNNQSRSVKVHLNVETGLHREGFDILQFENLLEEIKSFANLKVEGMMSHLACSNDPSCPTTTDQLNYFSKAKQLILQNGFNPKWFHLGGSLALLNELSKDCNAVRCGKAFFGIALNSSYQGNKTSSTNSLASNYSLPLVMKTQIAQVKKVKKGEHVGYADMFVADKDMTIGILPIGYYDGLDRRLSNKGIVKVDGVFCKIVGLVAMNVTVIDVSEVKDAKVNQEVIVYSDNPQDPNSLDNTAVLCSTLPQELLVRIPHNMPRKLVA